MCQHQGYFPLVLDGFTLLDIEGTSNGEMKPRAPSVAVEITRGAG